MFLCVLGLITSFPQTLKPELRLNSFQIYLSWTGARQFGSQSICAVPCLGMDLAILIFFCAHVLCVHCEDSEIERKREGEAGKEKKNTFDRSAVNYLPGV